MSKHWALLFAYHFPPENTIGAARPFRFYRYLPEFGFDCHVITAAAVEQLPELHAQRVADCVAEGLHSGTKWQLERAFRRFLVPGAIGTTWAFDAARAAERFIDAHPGDRFTIFSTYPPIGSHLAASILVRRKKLPWIADFRDPLRDNPIFQSMGQLTKRTLAWFEAMFLRQASALIANTDAARDLLAARYPKRAQDIHLIWNGFDPEQRVNALPVAQTHWRTFSHIGELYAGRTVRRVFESFRRLRAAGHSGALGTRINWTGPAEPDCLPEPASLAAAQAEGWLFMNPQQVPKAEAQHLAQTANLLLLAQPQSAVQVPGKLFEYVQIGRPILAFVPRGSAVERLLSRAGVPYRCVYTDTPESEFDYIVGEFLLLPDEPVAPSAWFEETFNGRSQTAALADILRRSQ